MQRPAVVSQRSPHDALFRAVFCQPARAAALLRWMLPKRLAEQIDWHSLRLVNSDFVDEHMRGSRSDLLFSVQLIRRPGVLFLLLEHQSKADNQMVLRLLGYMVDIWDRWLASNPARRTVPPIIPIVLSHDERGWRAATRLREVYAVDPALFPAMAANLPGFGIVLEDLRQRNDNELADVRMDACGRLALLLLKQARRAPNLRKRLAGWSALFAEVLAGPRGDRAFRLLVRYILAVGKNVSAKQLQRDLEPVLGETAGEVIMTEAERLIARGKKLGEERGKQLGKQLGEASGRAQAVLAVLRARRIAVSPELQARIIACTDVPTLDRWIARAATCASAEEVVRTRVGATRRAAPEAKRPRKTAAAG